MRFLFILIISGLIFGGCSNDNSLSSDDETIQQPESRNYRMGFMNSAPRPGDPELSLQALQMWTTRADAAIISTEVPWKLLLNGVSAEEQIQNTFMGLAEFYRNRGLKIWVYIDPQNGLDRTSDAIELQAAGRSIAEPEIQSIYKNYVMVIDSLLKPSYLGLALETNLIRDIAEADIYDGIKTAANEVAAELNERESTSKLSISIQADHAWGKLIGGNYQGIDQDLADFPFLAALGISSYPYFGFAEPEDIPLNYYSRLIEGQDFPVFVSEGGWTSATIQTGSVNIPGSPDKQARYIEHHDKLLRDVSSIAWFQLLFTDVDLNGIPEPVPENLPFFSAIGLVDIELNPKPSLTVWDELFQRELNN